MFLCLQRYSVTGGHLRLVSLCSLSLCSCLLQVPSVRWYGVQCVAVLNALVSLITFTHTRLLLNTNVTRCRCQIQLHYSKSMVSCKTIHTTKSCCLLTYTGCRKTFLLCLLWYMCMVLPPCQNCGLTTHVTLQDDHSTQQLLSQVLSKQEQLECFMLDCKRSLRSAVQQASQWRPAQQPSSSPTQQPQDQSSTTQQLPHPQHPSSHVPQGSGYVNICGIVLPSNTAGPVSQSAETGQQLVQTVAMQDDLRASALALSQRRPILLEGPPGGSHQGINM